MAKRVKKTDTREVDHWVSTDDGRHLPIDKDGNIIFGGSSKKSTYKKNLNGTYQRKEKRDGVLVQATVIPGRDKGKDFYTIKTGIGDDFESSDERYSTLSSAKNAADKALENRLNSKEDTSKSDSSKKKSTSKKSKVEFKEFKPEPWMDEEEMAEALFDSKDYIGDKALYQGVKDDLKSSGYSMGTKLTIDHAELVEYDGKSRYGTVEATYTIRDNGDFYGKKGTEYTERFQVPVVKDYSDSSSSEKFKSKTTNYGKLPEDIPTTIDRSDLKEIKSLYRKDRSAPSYIQQSPTSGAIMEKYINDATKEGADVKKLRQEFNNFKSDYLAAANLVKSKDAKDYITRKAKEYQKRFDDATRSTTSAPKPTRKTTSSKSNKLKDIFKGEKSSMVEWKINRAYDKTSLKELALDAGVSSSKVRTMSTEELRAMLLAMWKGK